MDNSTLEIITGIAVPAAAIIISTWVAVGLANAKRVAGLAQSRESMGTLALAPKTPIASAKSLH